MKSTIVKKDPKVKNFWYVVNIICQLKIYEADVKRKKTILKLC
jgi:hypothetical protein